MHNQGTDGVRAYRNRFSLSIQLPSSRKSSLALRRSADSSSTTLVSPTVSVTSEPFAPLLPISPTVSRLSFSGPFFSSTSIHTTSSLPQVDEPIPPTTNDLHAKEKAMLLKKARKLSRVFGEDTGFNANLASALTHIRPSSSGRQPLRTPSQPEIKLAPGLPHGLPQIKERVQHSSPTQALVENDIPSSSFLLSEGSVRPRSSSVTSLSMHRPSCLTEEQLRRAKVAKLTRYLGENIPPELITAPTYKSLQKAETLPPVPRARRQKSMGSLSSAAAPSADQKQLKRSRSLSGKQGQRATTSESAGFRARYEDNFGKAGKLTARQRLLAVKRARKMSRVFGHDPPKELLHNPRPTDDKPLPDLPDLPTPQLSPTTRSLNRQRTRSTSSSASLRDLPLEEIDREKDLPPVHVEGLEIDTRPPPSQQEFQDRRRRMKKLARFFGVGYQEISPSVHYDEFVTRGVTSGEVQVDVGKNGRRVWGVADGKQSMQGSDMTVVIDKLRAMKAN